jgi:hypothetical protein
MQGAGIGRRLPSPSAFSVTPHPPQQHKEVSAMVLIVCIMTGIATAALMSWLQPALERWAVRPPPRQATMGRSVPGRT